LWVDASVSEKHTVSIFRAKVVILGSGGIYIGSEEGKAEGVGLIRDKKWGNGSSH
jgi:hypothetical protein